MSKVIGIDLGTTNSCVSIVEGGTPKVIASSENLLTTPSVVAYKGDQIITGAPAKRQAVTNPKGTVTAAKRLIGRRADDPELVSKKEMFNDMIIENKNGDAWLSVDGNKVSPQQVSAQILMKMKKTAEDYLGESVSRAVITVPAYFNDAQRQATKDAGKIAGLEVERIINEPTAAALAYGLDKEGVEGKYLVYDLGGGTFDVSIIEIAQIDGETQFEVLSTAGDTLLGGEDFDMCIVNWLVDEFKAAQGIDLRSDTYSMQRLKEAAERAKIELTTAPQTEINLPYITGDQESGPKHLVQTLSKPKMEDLTRDLVEKTIEPVKRALKDASLKNSDIKDTILVGGQTRMQLVRDRVKQFMGKQPRLDINPDEAVAIGAAVQGAVLSGDRTDVLLLDVTPLSLGLETQGGVSTILIERNTTIPTSKTQIFSTAVDNQPAVTISVVQGERKKASENSQLGRFDLTDIAAAPRGMPQIEVTFDIDANGILNVSAKDKNTGKSNSVVIQGSSGLDQSEVERMVEEARKHESEDEAFEQLITLRNQGESLVYEGRKTLKELGSEVAEEDQKATRKTLDELEELLKGEDKQSIEDAIKNCGEALQPIMQAAATKKASESTEKGPAKKGSADKDEDIVDASFDEVDD